MRFVSRDKDQLWQKTDKLQYIQKLMASGKWLDDSDVKKCMSCNAEFSWMLRKVGNFDFPGDTLTRGLYFLHVVIKN